jgi:hypothetical protein
MISRLRRDQTKEWSKKPPRSGSGEKESCSAGKEDLFEKTNLRPGGEKGACQGKKEGYVFP